MNDYEAKKSEFLRKINKYTENDVMIAFSGGVDSSLLLKAACQCAEAKNTKVHAVTITSELQPIKDVEIALRVAAEIGAIHHVININELDNTQIRNNPKDRCYICKKYLFSKAKEFAHKLNITTIMDGTNEDDLHVYRPGIKALRELGILSPLAECKMTKDEVRRMAAGYGLSVASRPSAPCLATRFTYGTFLDDEKLKKVEEGENYLRSMGFKNVRLRVHANLARIEVDTSDFEKFMMSCQDVISYLKNLGYTYITLDLEGFRSGSMDLL